MIFKPEGERVMAGRPDRRDVVAGMAAAIAAPGMSLMRGEARTMSEAPDIIFFNGKVTTLDRPNPQAQAMAIRASRFVAVGDERSVMALAGPDTKQVDLKGRRVIPGLIDSHMHIIRGGLNYNLELRWDGVRSLADAMRMLKQQVDRTPAPQWVRVVGGFTAHQFVEKRLPTLEEINAVAPDTPVFILHLYDRALLNGAESPSMPMGTSRTSPLGCRLRCRIGLLLALSVVIKSAHKATRPAGMHSRGPAVAAAPATCTVTRMSMRGRRTCRRPTAIPSGAQSAALAGRSKPQAPHEH
jgi:hypothetical protein